jgi:transposase InsO family protein
LRIKNIRSNNRTKFKNSQIEGFLEEEGIKHEFSSPYTPQQNGVVERKNRTLLDMARTMLDEYKTPDQFWAEAINAVATPSTDSTFTESSRKHHMNSSPVKSPMFLILEFVGAIALFLLREVEILNLLLKQ